MIPASRFRHSSVTLEVCRLTIAFFIALAVAAAFVAVATAVLCGVILWGVIVLARAGWRRWHA